MISKSSTAPDVVVSAVPQNVARRAHVLGGASIGGGTKSPPAARALKCEGAVGLAVVTAESSRDAALRERGATDAIGQVRLDDADHAAEGIRAVQHAGRAADDLDPGRGGGLHAGKVIVTPLIVLQPLAVVYHENPGVREPADDGLPR